MNWFELSELKVGPHARHKGAMKTTMQKWGKLYDKLCFETEPPPLRALRIVDVCQNTERAASSVSLLGDTLEMVSQHNVLGIIAKFTAEQIYAAHIGGIFLDADPHENRLACFQAQVIQSDFGYLNTIHVASTVRHPPDLEQAILGVLGTPPFRCECAAFPTEVRRTGPGADLYIPDPDRDIRGPIRVMERRFRADLKADLDII